MIKDLQKACKAATKDTTINPPANAPSCSQPPRPPSRDPRIRIAIPEEITATPPNISLMHHIGSAPVSGSTTSQGQVEPPSRPYDPPKCARKRAAPVEIIRPSSGEAPLLPSSDFWPSNIPLNDQSPPTLNGNNNTPGQFMNINISLALAKAALEAEALVAQRTAAEEGEGPSSGAAVQAIHMAEMERKVEKKLEEKLINPTNLPPGGSSFSKSIPSLDLRPIEGIRAARVAVEKDDETRIHNTGKSPERMSLEKHKKHKSKKSSPRGHLMPHKVRPAVT